MSILPSISAKTYKHRFEDYVNYCTVRKQSLETSIFDYIVCLSKVYAPTTLQSFMSMIKKCMIDVNRTLVTDKAQSYLKKLHVSHTKKKANVFTSEQINKYMNVSSNNGNDLMRKVAIYLALYGALRIQELTSLSIEHLTVRTNEIEVKITHSKTDRSKEGFYYIVPASKSGNSSVCPVILIKKYLNSIPVSTGRLFKYFIKGKFTKRNVGKNTFGQLPRHIATTTRY